MRDVSLLPASAFEPPDGTQPIPVSRIGRPRLSERALPRLHFIGGRCRIVVHDIETGDVLEIGPREWVLLASADGTRDIEGILLAAAREGVVTSREKLLELLEGVADARMLTDGPPPRKVRTSIESDDAIRTAKIDQSRRPIDLLPGYTFQCDGHGSCCKLYSTIVFSPLESARARSLLPQVLEGGERHEHVFMPERGSGPCPGSAVALVDGRCAYLDGTLCSLHRAGGAGAKPLGCTLFPLALVDDGYRVRASVSVECACVLASLGKSGGEPILADTVLTRGDLDPAVVVDELPNQIEVMPGVRAPRDDYLRWSDAVLAGMPEWGDVALIAWALAGSLETSGLDAEQAIAAMSAPPPVDAELAGRFLAALADKSDRRAKAQNVWRSERDLCRRGVSIINAAATLLLDPEVGSAVMLGAGALPTDELFYLRVGLFGHQMVGSPLCTSLRDRAVAIWIARTFPLAADTLYPGEREPAFRHPLALVEALFRGHGLRRYTDALDAQYPSSTDP